MYDCSAFVQISKAGIDWDALRRAIERWVWLRTGDNAEKEIEAEKAEEVREAKKGNYSCEDSVSPEDLKDAAARAILGEVGRYAVGREIADLREIIEDVIDPETWQVYGGDSSIRNYGATLVVRTMPATQDRVEWLLNALLETRREARRNAIPPASDEQR